MKWDRLRKLVIALSSVISLIAFAAVVIEVGSFIVLRRVVSLHTWKTHPGEAMSVYRAPWGKRLWEEQRLALDSSYHPFLQRRSKPFQGTTIHVDAGGIRRTVNRRCEPGADVIWVFGGSTVWGLGNPDWTTIPSQLSAEFGRRGKGACVVNYGADAWTASQSVVKLMLELKQSDRRPNIVVFLNGCNDLYTPFRITGDPDLEHDYLMYRAILDQLVEANRGSWGWLRMTNAATLWKLRRGQPGFETPDPSALARKIKDAYFENVRVVEGLASVYHFKPLFYWQPMPIYGAKPLSAEEIVALEGLKPKAYRDGIEAARHVIPLMRSVSKPGFHYLGDLFDARRESLYLDACHLLPEGNRLIAQTIADDLLGSGDVTENTAVSESSGK